MFLKITGKYISYVCGIGIFLWSLWGEYGGVYAIESPYSPDTYQLHQILQERDQF